jgi:CheY-like chemotaxis protein
LRKRVLVADDIEQLRRSLVMILEQAGISSEEAGTGKQALARVKRTGLQFDLLITNLQMPDMDGLQLLTEVRRVDSQLPVLAISSSFGDRLLGLAATFGVATLEKPFTSRTFLSMVECFIAATGPIQPKTAH